MSLPAPRSLEELKAQFGSLQQTPDDHLYAYIDQESVRTKLKDERDKQGLDKYHDLISTTEIGIEVRRRARADLFFLARYICWGSNAESAGRTWDDNRICEEVHRRVCDFFIKKDNKKPLPEQDTVCKRRILLYPRLSMKSTIDVIDAVQWILNFPEIRILFLTAADDLAVGFVDEAKGHFIERPDEPTLMNLFFPEFCVSEKELAKETAFVFTCPVWKRQGIRRKEATIMASSIGSTLSGFHFEVVKADDPVSNKNSESEEQCKKVTKQLNVSVRKMLRQWGYFDGIGTRYADEDYWGDVLEKNVGEIDKKSEPCWELMTNLKTGQKILIGRAIVIKPEVSARLEKEGKPVNYIEASEAGCDLLFPDQITYSFLMQEYTTDEVSFEGQYNNNPRPASETPFTRPLLLRSTVTFEDMPFRGPTSQTWDFAFSKKKGRDYSTGSCAIWDEKGQCFINDLIRARLHHNDLAKAVVDFARRWHPFVIGIEDAAGSKFLEPAIIAEAQKTNDPQVIAVCSRIDWITPDNQKDAKKMRMATLHPWLVNGRMKFANYLQHLDVLYSEFERCLTSHHHDDIPDVISRQPRYAPSMQQLIEKNEIQTWTRSDAAWNLMFEENCDAFGRIGMGWTQPVDEQPVEEGPPRETPAPEYDPILGAGIYG